MTKILINGSLEMWVQFTDNRTGFESDPSLVHHSESLLDALRMD